jgi:cyclic pyranopterin phosphate synthase
VDFTHINEQGRARMVDVSQKENSERMARARAEVKMKPETLQAIKSGGVKKGDVLSVAQVAGVMGAKKTPDLIPMCHPLLLSSVDIDFEFDDLNSRIIIYSSQQPMSQLKLEHKGNRFLNLHLPLDPLFSGMEPSDRPRLL